jgi:hypothetical protein
MIGTETRKIWPIGGDIQLYLLHKNHRHYEPNHTKCPVGNITHDKLIQLTNHLARGAKVPTSYAKSTTDAAKTCRFTRPR